MPESVRDSVEKFKVLAREEFGLELTNAEAKDAATRLLQIHYLVAYCYKDLQQLEKPVSESSELGSNQ